MRVNSKHIYRKVLTQVLEIIHPFEVQAHACNLFTLQHLLGCGWIVCFWLVQAGGSVKTVSQLIWEQKESHKFAKWVRIVEETTSLIVHSVDNPLVWSNPCRISINTYHLHHVSLISKKSVARVIILSIHERYELGHTQGTEDPKRLDRWSRSSLNQHYSSCMSNFLHVKRDAITR